jgi:T5SS/PEP-CTERM-associated repeat protein
VNSGSSLYSGSNNVGYNGGVTGVATVDGTGATWRCEDYYIGTYGSGTLNVTGGGVVANYATCYVGYYAGSTGTVMVDGSGSQWGDDGYGSDVGYYGNGTIKITNGGCVSTGDALTIGHYSGSTGTVTVDGSGSQLNEGGPGGGFGVFVGASGNGTLNITGGGVVNGNVGIGGNVGGTGIVTVNGVGSKLFNGGVTVGSFGNGTLNVTGGGTVCDNGGASNPTYIGTESGSTGTVMVDGTGSTWTCTNGQLIVGYSGSATLNITGGGAVSDANGYIGYAVGSTAVVKVDGAGSRWTNSSELDIGYGMNGGGNGTLNITNGGIVSNTDGYISHYSGSVGNVTVNGAGSKWINSGKLYVGYAGRGTLTIIGGATVSDYSGVISEYSGATSSVVSLDGAGSQWTNSNGLSVGGFNGTATLNISGGGTVAATVASINNSSLLAIDVGTGSRLSVGNGIGTFYQDATVRILAGAGVKAGNQYTPISAGSWNDSNGTYQAVGGTWDASKHVFTVSDVQSGKSGELVTIDLAEKQRVLINDSATGWSVGASFLASASSKPLTFTATTIGSDALTSLDNLLGPGQSFLRGWEFAATGGYAAGDPAYLSFDLGAGYSRNGLEIWHYDGSSWTEFAANDLTYDGTYASFTVTGFSGYAVTTVPEPGTLVLLVVAALGVLPYARRKR